MFLAMKHFQHEFQEFLQIISKLPQHSRIPNERAFTHWYCCMCFADIFVARKQIFKILLVCTQHHTAAQQHYSCGRDASSVRMHLVVNYRKACVCDTFIIQDISTQQRDPTRYQWTKARKFTAGHKTFPKYYARGNIYESLMATRMQHEGINSHRQNIYCSFSLLHKLRTI